MKYSHAAKGIKKIFAAEILSLIAVILFGVVTGFVISSGYTANEQSASIPEWAAIFFVICGIAAAVILLVSAIFNIIGYFQASVDEIGFRKALFCTIYSFLLMVGATLLQNQTGALGWLYTILYVLAQAFHLMVYIFSVTGLMNLAARNNRPDMVEKGRRILSMIEWIYILYIIVLILTRLFRENVVNTTIAGILSAISLILAVAQYVLYLRLLGKTARMLS